MPLPNSKIVSALFASYFQIRHDTWGLIDGEEFALPIDEVVIAKIGTVMVLINQINNAVTMDDWIKVIYDLADKERIEDENYSGKRFFGLASYFVDRPLLKDTIRAARSYIISKLDEEKDFKETKTDLINDLVELKGRIAYETERNTITKESLIRMESMIKSIEAKLTAMESLKYHQTFYNEVVNLRDFTAKVAKLNEVTFEDFEQNVTSGARSLSLLDKVSAAWQKKQHPTVATAPEPVQAIVVKPLIQPKVEKKEEAHVFKFVEPSPVFDESVFDFDVPKAAAVAPVSTNPSTTFARKGKQSQQASRKAAKQQGTAQSKQTQKTSSGYRPQ